MESLLNAESVDLILCGPPYWNEVIYSDDSRQLSTRESYDDFLDDIQKVWQGCAYALKPGGILAFWIHDFYRDNKYIPFHNDLARHLPPDLELKNIIVWDRYLHRTRDYIPDSPRSTRLQYIIIAQKTGRHPFNAKLIQDSLRFFYWHPIWSHKTVARLLGSTLLFKIFFYLTRPFGNLLNYPRKKINDSKIIQDDYTFNHYATECPPDIAKMLIEKFSRQGDTILDPFMGSGTTLEVATKMQRNAIGIDINIETLNAISDKLKRQDYEIIQRKEELF